MATLWARPHKGCRNPDCTIHRPLRTVVLSWACGDANRQRECPGDCRASRPAFHRGNANRVTPPFPRPLSALLSLNRAASKVMFLKMGGAGDSPARSATRRPAEHGTRGPCAAPMLNMSPRFAGRLQSPVRDERK